MAIADALEPLRLPVAPGWRVNFAIVDATAEGGELTLTCVRLSDGRRVEVYKRFHHGSPWLVMTSAWATAQRSMAAVEIGAEI